MDWIEIRMEEYKMIRDEILHFANASNVIISIGLPIIFALAGTSVAGENYNNSRLYIFLIYIAIPVLAFVFLTLWFGSVERMNRASRYVRELELEIADYLKCDEKKLSNPLRWEAWIHSNSNFNKKGSVIVDYIIIILMFIFIEFSGLFLGGYRVIENHLCNKWIVIVGTFILFITTLVFYFYRGKRVLFFVNEEKMDK